MKPFALAFLIPFSSIGQLTILDSPPSQGIVVKYEKYDLGGNTSVVNEAKMSFKFSGESAGDAGGFGYFDSDGKEHAYIKRNRDLGQTFTFNGSSEKKLKSITVKTGYGSKPAREGIFGASISLQLMEVSGEGKINDNGSKGEMKAFHGFPHDRYHLDIPAERDDYLEGEIYTHLKLWGGFLFPSKLDFGLNPTLPSALDDEKLKGRFLNFQVPSKDSFLLIPGKSYAFIIMIDQKGEEKAFTLANNYSGTYPEGHGIRRTGDGTFPLLLVDTSKKLSHKTNKKALNQAQLPAKMKDRVQIQPGTNGYPDVDTFRDLVFYIEVED